MELFENKILFLRSISSESWEIDDIEEFGIRLSAPSCYVRGWNLYYIEIDNVNYEQLDKLLETAYITDKETLLRTVEESINYGVGSDYEQFISFWNDTPCFDIEKLKGRGKEVFLGCMTYAEKMRPLVNDKGFAAWDYSETIQFIRMGFMKKWITYDEAKELLLSVVNKAVDKYKSWKEFAISYICGGTYFMYKSSGFNEEKAEGFFDVLCSVVQEIVSENREGYWQ